MKPNNTNFSSTQKAVIIVSLSLALILIGVLVNMLTNKPVDTNQTSDGGAQQIQNTNTGAPITVSWEKLGEMKGEMQELLFDPKNTKVAYLSAADQGVYRSEDGGTNWTLLGPQNKTILDFSIDPKSGRLYAADLKGIVYSDDRGESWNNTSLPSIEGHAVQVDPRDSKIIWAGFWLRGSSGSTLYLSNDSGKNWKEVEGGPQGNDINFVKFDKDSNKTYVGTYGGGLFVTNNNGTEWQDLNNGLDVNTDITELEWNSDQSVFYVGTHDFGTFRSTDQGKSWESVNLGKESATDVHGLAADPKDPNSIYVVGMMMGKGLFKSSNTGDTWQSIDSNGVNLEDVHVFNLSPDGKHIYIGAGEHGAGKGILYRFKI